MSKRVEILSQTEIFSRFIFHIQELRFRHQRYDGTMSDELSRVHLDRGDGAAVVVHDLDADTVLLIEQFRVSTYHKSPGWLIELPAGIVETGEDPSQTMLREITEETGYITQTITPISTFYLSPGGSSERIHLFYAPISANTAKTNGGGLAHEGEDIRTLVMPVNEALAMIGRGEIMDAKTIIGLWWLALNRGNLPR